MWVLTMFDLPVLTAVQRKRYANFRKKLLRDGFIMLQYSVYARPCPSEENAKVHAARVKAVLPEEGEVRVIQLTDLQFSRMEIFAGKKRQPTEKTPEQLTLF